MAKENGANAISGLLDLANKMGKPVPVEEKALAKEMPAKKAVKPAPKKDVKKVASATTKKASDKVAKAKESVAAKTVKKEEKPAPKKKEAVEEKTVTPVVDKPAPVKEEEKSVAAPVTTEKEGKSINISSYYSTSQIRLMKAAARKKKVPLSVYISSLVAKDLEENEELYESVAKKLDAVAAIEDEI